MDTDFVVTGAASTVLPEQSPADATLAAQRESAPWLKNKKMRKFMGKQDHLAVTTASQASAAAKLDEAALQSRTGLFLCVGYIPFEQSEIEAIARNSTQDGDFSMERFSTEGFGQVNPLLTFRCLPNMPIFHVSLNLGIQGPYFITYPDIGQFYLAMEQAMAALERKTIDYALVGAVADQNNFLVRFHLDRLSPNRHAAPLDAGGFLCLERVETAEERGASIKAELLTHEIGYQAQDPFEPSAEPLETLEFESQTENPNQKCRAASFAVSLGKAVAENRTGRFFHRVTTQDGIRAASEWRLL